MEFNPFMCLPWTMDYLLITSIRMPALLSFFLYSKHAHKKKKFACFEPRIRYDVMMNIF